MTGLPDDLRDALARLTEGLSRRELAERARAISEGYRGGGTSKPIADSRDALAYALARMPATYAAVRACLTALHEARPDFQPSLDDRCRRRPRNGRLGGSKCISVAIGHRPARREPRADGACKTLMAGNERLADAGFRIGPASQLLANAPGADLVVASYLIGELSERERAELASLLWERTRDTLLVVEPGTPAGYARIIALRAQLIADGAHVLAPCPHDNTCPLVAPDWCHFAQRLPRSRDHMLMKDADVPFEDEKFSYVALSRVPATTRAPRVLAPPHVGKAAVEAKLCTTDGVAQASIPRRDKAAYASARRWRWGDAVT